MRKWAKFTSFHPPKTKNIVEYNITDTKQSIFLKVRIDENIGNLKSSKSYFAI